MVATDTAARLVSVKKGYIAEPMRRAMAERKKSGDVAHDVVRATTDSDPT